MDKERVKNFVASILIGMEADSRYMADNNLFALREYCGEKVVEGSEYTAPDKETIRLMAVESVLRIPVAKEYMQGIVNDFLKERGIAPIHVLTN